MPSDEAMFLANEFLNSEKWLHAVNENYGAQQIAVAEFAQEVTRMAKAREEARR